MPDDVDSCVEQVQSEQGKDEEEAWAICVDSVVNNSDEPTDDLHEALERAGASEMHGMFERLIQADVEKDLVKEVIDGVLIGGSREMAFGKLSKSDRLEKVNFEASVSAKPTIFKAGDDFIVWGPASVEIVDKEGDRIQASALQNALPQLLKRARLSLEHSDQIVGRILENFKTDKPVEVEVAGHSFTRKEFPTDVLELDGMEPALYVAGEIFNDTRQSREARKKIEDGTYDSYSISGEALVTRKKIQDGEAYNDIVDMDLSAVTICEEGMNQKAEFGVVSDSADGEVEASSDDASGGRVEPSAGAIAAVAKSATEQTMSKEDYEGGDEPDEEDEEGLDEEELQNQFKAVLEQSLNERFPEGDLATKNDILDRSDVEDIAEKVYERYADADIPEPSEGASEANTEKGEVTGQQEGGDRAGSGSEDDAGDQNMTDEGQPNSDARTHANPAESDTSGDQARSEGAPDSMGENVSQKAEDDAGDQDMEDSGYSETDDDPTGRPGDEADVHGDQAASEGAPDSEGEDINMKGLEQKVDQILAALKEGEVDIDDLEDPDGDDEEEMPVEPESDDEDMPAEGEMEDDEKGDDMPPEMQDDEEMPPEEEEEEMPPEEPGGTMEQRFSAEELQQSLPDDVWEVAREYIGAEEEQAGAHVEASDEAEKSATNESEIESAVRKVLSGSGLEKTEGASTPGASAEKSWSDEEPSDEAHGDNPALANFY